MVSALVCFAFHYGSAQRQDFCLGAFSRRFAALFDTLCDELVDLRFGESGGANANLYRRLDTASSDEPVEGRATHSDSGAGFTYPN
jgi:hypothetical protein